MGQNVVIHGKDSTDVLSNDAGKVKTSPVLITSNAAHVLDQSHFPGGRNETSTTADYLVITDQCNLTIVDIQTAITIGGGAANDTHLKAIHITTALTGTIVITGFEGSAGTPISITIPAATPAGIYDFKGAINSAGALTITASNAADDNNIQILWWPI